MGQEIGSVAVVGLGRIGLPLAAAFAGAGCAWSAWIAIRRWLRR